MEKGKVINKAKEVFHRGKEMVESGISKAIEYITHATSKKTNDVMHRVRVGPRPYDIQKPSEESLEKW